MADLAVTTVRLVSSWLTHSLREGAQPRPGNRAILVVLAGNPDDRSTASRFHDAGQYTNGLLR